MFFSAVFSAFVYQILYPGVIKLKRMKICGNYTGYGINNMGQNLGHDFVSWDVAIQSWFDEHENYEKYIEGDGSKNGKPVKHYKQVNIILQNISL